MAKNRDFSALTEGLGAIANPVPAHPKKKAETVQLLLRLPEDLAAALLAASRSAADPRPVTRQEIVIRILTAYFNEHPNG